MKNINVIKKNIKKYYKNDFFKAKFVFTKYYENSKINENEVLLQSYDGSSISGNVYYILLELCKNEKYKNLKKYVVANKKNLKKIQETIENKGLKNVEVIVIHSETYCKKLAEAKYLINNSTFPSYFIKNQNQIYVNTWHGTPLKGMGRNIKNSPNELGNTQRNFLMADYLLYPNEFTFEHMKNDYMLNNLYKGKYVISGYPRNTAFFDDELKQQIKDEMDLNNKKVFVYMPTWRGSLDKKNNEKQLAYILYTLFELDKNLDKDTVIYVKLHNYTNSFIKYDMFKNIKQFPNEYETYEFLNVADCLITDYSSVFFDFANTGKKIILYAYDKDEYIENRGMYIDYDKLPFDMVTNVQDLLSEINSIHDFENFKKNIDKSDENTSKAKQFEFYKIFQDKFDKYDNKYVTKNLCEIVFDNSINKRAGTAGNREVSGEKNDKENQEVLKIIDGGTFCNDKRNVLIFGGALSKNGITTALKGLINNVDKNEFNYFLTFYKNKVEENKQTINDFNKIDYIPIQGSKDMSVFESICHFLYYRFNINNQIIRKNLEHVYKREIKRIYPNLKFDYVIHYSGYEKQIMHLFKYMDAKKILYLHNDMKKEIQTKQNVHEKSFKEALESFDNIVAIRETSKNEILEYYSELDENKVVVAHNLNNIDEIKQKSQQEVKFDKDTYCNVSLEELNKILDDDKIFKFINIARFSPEKGQDRLINAFLEYKKQHENSYLIIIGGNGIDFSKINDMVLNSENIIIIKSISNPYPILDKCNLFVLSSHYEGLPMTIMEALILGKEVVSTDITGPKEFLQDGYGFLVEDSEKGILNGMIQFAKGGLKTLKKFDAAKFNKNALDEFEGLIK